MARYGYNWQVPFRVAEPGYQEYMIKYLNQISYFAANIQDLINSRESLTRFDINQVKGYLLNHNALPVSPFERLSLYGLPKVSLSTEEELSGSTKANILPGYLFIKVNMPNNEVRMIFDSGDGSLTSYNTVIVGSINYESGTYKLNSDGLEYTKGATSYVITYCDGEVSYPELIESTKIDSYEVSGGTVKTAGTGYKVDDEVLAGKSVFKVTAVSEDGSVTTVTLHQPAKSSTDVAGDIPTTGGSGTGLVLTVTTATESTGLMKCEGAVPGAAASLPGVAIYFTSLSDRVYVGYNTTNESTLSEIFNLIKL